MANILQEASASVSASFSTEDSPKEATKLVVSVGPDATKLSKHKVNVDTDPTFVVGPHFVGNVTVRVKDFEGASTDYFGDRKRIFSIQVQGRFRKAMTVDDCSFGAQFDDKVSPPYVAYPAFKLAQVIDPALRFELNADKPWLLSPAFCAMNTIQVLPAPKPISEIQLDATESMPLSEAQAKYAVNDILGEWTWGGEAELKEDVTQMFKSDVLPFPAESYTDRRKWFGESENRRSTKISPDKVYNLDIFAPLYVILLSYCQRLMRCLASTLTRLMFRWASLGTCFRTLTTNPYALSFKTRQELRRMLLFNLNLSPRTSIPMVLLRRNELFLSSVVHSKAGYSNDR